MNAFNSKLIHPTAIIADGAQLGAGVSVGPYAMIGAKVRVGAGTRIGPHVLLDGAVEIGEENVICAGAVIGAEPQIKAEHGSGRVTIGRKNVFREYVTIHAAGAADRQTLIGDSSFVMSGVHIAHDCRIGNHVIIANGTQLSGFVEIDDHAFLSGLAGVHQFVRIGQHAMVGGLTKLVTDVIPFALCDGNPARVRGANVVGLKRRGFKTPRVLLIKKAIQTLYFSGMLRGDAVQALKGMAADSADIRCIVEFIGSSKRGIAPRAMNAGEE
jgi:UDP-N-acetylglucosamine acyltransferase